MDIKIKLLVSRVGAGFSQLPGEEVEVETGEAQRLVDSQQAVFVESPVFSDPIETAEKVEDRIENAEKKTQVKKQTYKRKRK